MPPLAIHSESWITSGFLRNTSKIIRGDRASRTSRLLLLDLELTIWASERVNSGRATMLLLEADRYRVRKWPLGKPDLPGSQWYFSDVPYRESNVRNEVFCSTLAFSAAQPEPDCQLAAPDRSREIISRFGSGRDEVLRHLWMIPARPLLSGGDGKAAIHVAVALRLQVLHLGHSSRLRGFPNAYEGRM